MQAFDHKISFKKEARQTDYFFMNALIKYDAELAN